MHMRTIIGATVRPWTAAPLQQALPIYAEDDLGPLGWDLENLCEAGEAVRVAPVEVAPDAALRVWGVSRTLANLGFMGLAANRYYSAHVYARDWNAANEVVAKHHDTNREPAWDQRTSWYVQKIPPVVEEKPIVVGEVLDIPRPASGVINRWEIQGEPAGPGMVVALNQTSGERARIPEHMWRERRGDYRGPQPKPTLRATALTPDGSKVVAVFEAETAEALRAMIERSGLVTSIGAAMWLGDEIRKLAGPGGQNHG